MSRPLLLLLSLLMALTAWQSMAAEPSAQTQQVGRWQVHYSAIPSSFLSPAITRQYQIERSRYNGIITLTVLDAKGVAQSVALNAEATNLTGTRRELAFREIKEGPAIYYLAEIPYRNEDNWRIKVTLLDQGVAHELQFMHTFYVD